MNMRAFVFAITVTASGMVSMSQAISQTNIQRFESEGNLKIDHELGCLGLSDIRSDYSPADLAGGALQCFKEMDDDRAIKMLLVMNLRATFDTKRVADKTAHQAGGVLLFEVANQIGQDGQDRLSRAFERFGDTGSSAHNEMCASQLEMGVPSHSPNYMIQHGMAAFLEREEGDESGLVPDFDPQSAWSYVLVDYFKCSF